jgi:ubiquinone/menaquinone biosynthesis C-methylase UbiE
VTFDVTADAYARFMGRFSAPLAERFVDLLAPRPGPRALDVGCGPGALTAPLVGLLGVDAVAAVDPSEPFVASVRAALPGLDVRTAAAERLPFDDDGFDLALAQLVVHFMADPVAGLREMARVTRPGGTVAASVWDHSSGRGPLSTFWAAVTELDPGARDESGLAGVREGHLAALCDEAGLHEVQPEVLSVRVGFTDFEDWWAPYTLGVGPAGAYVARLGPDRREELRARCAQRLPDGPFEIEASAWCVRAHA